MFRRLLAILPALALVLGLGACDTVKSTLGLGPDKKAKLKGERIPVLLAEQDVKPDARIQDVAVELPPPQKNPDWPQAGGNAAHDMQHVALGRDVKEAWRISIGSGKSKEWKHLAGPVVGGGRIYTMDTDSVVKAFNPESGAKLWETEVKPEGDIGAGDVGGGVAYADDVVYVTNNYGEVLALDAKTGAVKWRRPLAGPTRAAPTIGGGRLFVVTADNQLHAMEIKDGRVIWTHAGLAEVTGLLGAASPAYEAGVVMVPYSSGEIYALRADNGRVLWSDTLASIRRADAVSNLADIRGNPVIDRDRVIAIGHSGRSVAIDVRSGARAWEDPIGGIWMPWVAGNYVFLLSSDSQLICVMRRDGRIRWAIQLDRWEDPAKKTTPVLWVGPILAGGQLVVASSDSRLLFVSPKDGTILNTLDAGDPVSVPPIVANGTLYVLTDAGDLRAYR